MENVTQSVRQVMADEVTVEDRLNEEVREILSQALGRNEAGGRFLPGNVQESQRPIGPRKEADPPLMRLTREKTVRISHRIIDLLVTLPDVDFVEDRDTIRQEIVTILTSLLKVEEQVDTEVRAKIASQKKEILEGSEEWDILYRKYYQEGLKRLGVAEVHAHG